MRMNLFTTLRTRGALLMLGLVLGIAQGAVAQGRDFSDGLTDAAKEIRAYNERSSDWADRQADTEAEAARALAAGKRSVVAPGQVGPGDKIKLTVFGEENLSGEFEVDNTGSLAIPLVGEINVRGLTPREVERKVAHVLENGYLKSPRVNIEVLNFRPFFILGEVNKPGSYPYANEMTVINAVALGGGYTTRAKTGKIIVRRASTPDKEEWISEDALVYPGDVLRVDERFF
jgi:protein involved in polysaccharide export with SLBB domain